jgi:hypothetical protein
MHRAESPDRENEDQSKRRGGSDGSGPTGELGPVEVIAFALGDL